MKAPPASTSPLRGDDRIRDGGFSYLPRFLTADEADEVARFTASLHPIWESRYADGDPRARGSNSRLTRPVYWLGAWQFACLGYYAEPDHTEHRCVRGEPMPPVFHSLLSRLQEELALQDVCTDLPNTCLINYYGSERPDPDGPPIDRARLRMHRDAEPGPVLMISVGQPAQFEFVQPGDAAPVHSQWVRHRSAVVLSGPLYKDTLYHRITRVRHGTEPVLHCDVPDFSLRRISISFRHVPESAIADASDLPPDLQDAVRPFIDELAPHRPHWAQQLDAMA